MARRIWIIPRKDQVEQADLDAAQANNCPEIVNGIPPALQGIISESDLPMAYEEPEPVEPVEPEPTPPLCTHWAKVDSFNQAEEKPMRVRRTWNSREYTVDCYVTENIKDQYQAGDVAVGDFVLVEFLEDSADKAVVFAKVLETW